MIWSPSARYCLPDVGAAQSVRSHMQKIESMKSTRCAEHMSFTYARGLRPALYKGLHATAARLVQKVVAGSDSGNRALRVKLTKMLNVPGVAH